MAFTRALGGKSLDDSIRVVGINPGPVDTERNVTLLKTRARKQWGDEKRYGEMAKNSRSAAPRTPARSPTRWRSSRRTAPAIPAA